MKEYLFSDDIDSVGRDNLGSLVRDYIDEKGYNITERRLFKEGPLECVAAFEDKEATGFINYCHSDERKVGRLEHIYVSQKKRKQGIGTKLLETAVKDLACAEVEKIITSPFSEEAKSFMEVSNFEAKDFEQGPLEGKKVYGVLEEIPEPENVLGKSADERRQKWRK